MLVNTRATIYCPAGALRHPTLRDNEDAYVSVNGKTCWTRTDVLGTVGTQQCGGFFKEEGFRVRGCYATLSASEGLTVRVWTNLDGAANDESFGINNVVITKIEEGNIERIGDQE